jgi:hypothetical protein
MRRRIRIQPYVSPETQRKLRAFASAQALSESSVAEAAILEFVDRNPIDEDLVLRRLDGLSQSVAQVQRDTDITSHALSFLARYTFLAAPQTLTAEAKRNAEELYETFLSAIARQLQAGTRMENEIRRAVARRAAASVPGTPQGGR